MLGLSANDDAELSLRGAEAAGAWRRAIDEAVVAPLFAMIGPEDGFEARYVERRLAQARLADVRGEPLALVDAAAPDRVLLQAVVEGRAVLWAADGANHALRAGQVLVRRPAPEMCLRSERAARVVVIALPAHLLAAAALAAAHAPLEGRAATLLHQLAATLADAPPPSAAAVAAMDALAALARLALAPTEDEPPALPELAAAQAARILAYLRSNYANPALDPQTLADDLSISVRYAHKLMRQTGHSFRETLVGLRLQAARDAFAANAWPRQTIADIAISVGFNDLSQFNRHFRTAFGMTPRQARRLDEAAADAGLARAPVAR